MDSGVRRMIHSEWYHGYVTGVLMVVGAEILIAGIVATALWLS
jgi:hypothetical protein